MIDCNRCRTRLASEADAEFTEKLDDISNIKQKTSCDIKHAHPVRIVCTTLSSFYTLSISTFNFLVNHPFLCLNAPAICFALIVGRT